LSNWEWRAETSTGGEDGQYDLEDELDYCGSCLCSIWMFTGGCMLQRSNSDVKSGAFASSMWMKNETLPHMTILNV
jgi:hypothetical protein